jgi:hypothetical protein
MKKGIAILKILYYRESNHKEKYLLSKCIKSK